MILWNIISVILIIWSVASIAKRTNQGQPVFVGGSIVPITFLWFIGSLVLSLVNGGSNV